MPLPTWALGLSLGLGGLSTAYNVYSNERMRSDQDRMNRQMMEREDTAMQRRVADLQAAGLHPILALGTPGASSHPMQTPQRNPVDNQMKVLETLMARSQVDNMNAQTENMLKLTELAERRFNEIELPDHKLRDLAEDREQKMHFARLDDLLATSAGKRVANAILAKTGLTRAMLDNKLSQINLDKLRKDMAFYNKYNIPIEQSGTFAETRRIMESLGVSEDFLSRFGFNYISIFQLLMRGK